MNLAIALAAIVLVAAGEVPAGWNSAAILASDTIGENLRRSTA